MDRKRSLRSFDQGAVRPDRIAQSQSLLSSCARGRSRSRAHEAYRRDLYRKTLPWFQSDYPNPAQRRPLRQSETDPGDHAKAGTGWVSTWAQHLKKSPGTHQISVSFAGFDNCASPTGVELGHNVYSASRRFYLPRGSHRLVQPVGVGISAFKQPGRRVLRRSLRRGDRALWKTGDFQYRPGGAVFLSRIRRCHPKQGHPFQHGWAWASTRQYFCGTLVEIREV